MKNRIWDLESTRSLMRSRLSGEDFDSARRSLASAVDRREYARLHFHEIRSRWAKLLTVAATPDGVWDIVLGGSTDSEIDDENESNLHAIRAHTIACVQSLHAIPDIFAHGIYHALGFAAAVKLQKRNINVCAVGKILSKSPLYSHLGSQLNKLGKAGEAKYLGALANHGKHRSIVRNAVSVDMTGADQEPIRLKFESFQFDNIKYHQCDVLPLLEAEFNRISKIVVDSGIELHRVLEKTSPATTAIKKSSPNAAPA